MTDTTLVSPPTTARRSTGSTRQPSVLPDLLRSEWAKIRSVRSTYWSSVASTIAMIGSAAISAASQTGPARLRFDPVSTSLAG